MEQIFVDRIDAGGKLTHPLSHLANHNPVILGMARGGMILAAEIANRLDLQLDVLVVRKVGAPSNPEYGVGAVAPMDVTVCDEEVLRSLRLSDEDMRPIFNRELAEVERRLKTYRVGMPALDLANRTVILVDDGLATGITAIAAARYAKKLGAAYLVYAAPVCSKEGSASIAAEVEEVVCLQTPESFFAVGAWYRNFDQVEDQEIIEIMEVARKKEYLS